jgi:hypothetical protein
MKKLFSARLQRLPRQHKFFCPEKGIPDLTRIGNGYLQGQEGSYPNMNEKRNAELQPYEILQEIVPRGKARYLANMLGISESLVIKWQREPTSDENPTATGASNPIERVERILEFAFLYSPKAAQLLVSHFQAMLSEFYARVTRQPLTSEEWRNKLGQGNVEVAEAISAIIQGEDPVKMRKEWEEAKAAIEEMVLRAEAGEQQHS